MSTITIGQFAPEVAGEKPCRLDVHQLLTTKMLITANSGGGKSYLMRVVLEGIGTTTQTIVLDVEGEFITLREKLDMVLVGPQGEIPTDLRSAALLVRRLMEKQLSAVIDLSELKYTARKEYVRTFCEAMIELPKSLWNPCFVAIDETDKFCPEKGQGESVSTEAVLNLFTLGRKRGFCGLAATQRLSALHKGVAAEANNKFVGRTSLDVDLKRAASELGITPREAMALRELNPGEFHCYGPALSNRAVALMKTATAQTTHPKPGHGKRLKPPEPSSAIKAVLKELTDLPKEADEEIKTLAAAKAEIIKLQREMRQSKTAAPAPAPAATVIKSDPKSVQELRVKFKQQSAQLAAMRKGLDEAMKIMAKINSQSFADAGVDPEQIKKAINQAAQQIVKLTEQKVAHKVAEFEKLKREVQSAMLRFKKLLEAEEVTVQVDVQHQPPFTVQPAHGSHGSRVAGDFSAVVDDPAGRKMLTETERDVLDAVASFPQGATKQRISIYAGRSIKSSSFLGCFSGGEAAGEKKPSLVQAGLMNLQGDKYFLTEAGAALARSSGGTSLADWLLKLQPSEVNVLKCLVAHHPIRLTREQVAESTSTSIKSSSFLGAFPALRDLGLIEGKTDFKVVDALMEQYEQSEAA